MSDPKYLLRVFLTVWLIYLVHYNPSPLGSDRYVYVTMSLVERGTLNIDPYAALMIDKVCYADHCYSDVSPALAIMAAPAWAAVHSIIGHVTNRNVLIHYFAAHFACFATTTALLSALGSVTLFALMLKRTRSYGAAWFTMLLYSLGSIAFYFSTFMHNNATIAALLLLWFALVYDPEAICVVNPRLRWTLAGGLVGLMVFIDLGTLIMAAVLVALMWRKVPGSNRTEAVACLLLPVCLLGLCQYLAFHNPILPPQAYLARVPGSPHAHGMWGMTLPRPGYIVSMFISPSIGLFLYMPFTLFSFAYLCRRTAQHSTLLTAEERAAALWICGAQVLFVGSSYAYQEQFGPRYLLPPLALLTLVFGLGMAERRWRIRGVLAALCALSFVLNIAGAQIGIGTNNVLRILGVWLLRGPWLPTFTWIAEQRAQTPGGANYGLHPWGVFILLTVTLALIWRSHLEQWLRSQFTIRAEATS